MPRRASLSGFRQQFTPTEFEDDMFKITPSSEGMAIKDKTNSVTIDVPARYIIALEKVGKSTKHMYEAANTPDEDDEPDAIDAVENLLA